MKSVNIKINNIPLTVDENMKIIEAAKLVNIDIPHLCYHPDQAVSAHCRMCVVEVIGSRKLVSSCSTKVWDGMEVYTNTEKVIDTQKGILELILADHNQDCLSCSRNQNCELQKLSNRFNITKTSLTQLTKKQPPELNNPSLLRDPSKCIKCGRCVKVCRDIQGVCALTYSNRSGDFEVSTAFNLPLDETDCTLCGQCSLVCPVGAIVEVDDTSKAWKAIHDPQKHVIVQVAPAVRVALGDDFGMDDASTVTGKIITALRMLGFDKVFDTNFAADLTIMEEGSELLHRLENNGVLPMLTSCSPGWINYMEKHHSDKLSHLSTAKSPQQMFGAIAKSYYPKVTGINPEDIITVSVMPCTAKKYEATRPEMESNGLRDVDIVITTRELAKMIKTLGINFAKLNEDDFDTPLGVGSGAGAIFGTTGGVMEAALRTVVEILTGNSLEKLNFEPSINNESLEESALTITENIHAKHNSVDIKPVCEYEIIKEASLTIDDKTIKVAIVHGLKNAEIILKEIESGNCDYTFVEVMTCPRGCIGGGGQPLNTTVDVTKFRMDALYSIDKNKTLRKSHENPDIQKLYKEFLGKPLGPISHHLLHTEYKARK
ncbi:MAG: [FeFe] hydrogenase, group A [Clostridium sp.]